MNRSRARGLTAALGFVVLLQNASPCAAAGNAVTISGNVKHPLTLTAADLQKRPPATLHVSFVTGHGEEQGTFTGALLWQILSEAAMVDEPGKNARLRHTVIVKGRDGYAVALSEGELDPDFEGKTVILAYFHEGKPPNPTDGIRLIVPGDKHGGRAVRAVIAVDVR